MHALTSPTFIIVITILIVVILATRLLDELHQDNVRERQANERARKSIDAPGSTGAETSENSALGTSGSERAHLRGPSTWS